MTFVAQLVHFAVLVAIIYFFGYQPVADNLAARTDRIRTEIANADRDQAEAKRLKEEYEGKLAQARTKAEEIIAAANRRGNEEYQASVEKTRTEIEQMKEAAAKKLERDRQFAEQQIKGQMVSLSLAVAERLIGANIDKAANEKLVDDFIRDLDHHKIGDLPC